MIHVKKYRHPSGTVELLWHALVPMTTTCHRKCYLVMSLL